MGSRAKISFVVVATQAVIVLVVTAVTFISLDSFTAIAVLVGGAIGISATAIFSFRVFSGQREWSPERFLRRLYRAETLKIVFISVFLVVALRYSSLSPIPLLLGFIVSQTANWFVLLFKRLT